MTRLLAALVIAAAVVGCGRGVQPGYELDLTARLRAASNAAPAEPAGPTPPPPATPQATPSAETPR